MPSNESKKSLESLVTHYHSNLPGSPAEKHLNDRGLGLGSTAESLSKFRFGCVVDPPPEHEQFKGMLAIPYLRRSYNGWRVADIRFRCLAEGCKHKNVHYGGKYITMPGGRPRVYNTNAILDNHDFVAITEGELDAVASTLAGVPAVALPGATTWKPHFSELFEGFETVLVLADGDSDGRKAGNRIASDLKNAKLIHMPDKEDVNSYLLANGAAAFRKKVLG